MNRQELVERIAEATGDSKASTERHLDAFLECVADSLVSGDKLSLAGFGHFYAKPVERHSRFNPHSREMEESPRYVRISFKPGSKLKARVNNIAVPDQDTGE